MGGGERCATNGARALSLNNNLPKGFIGDLFACTLALNRVPAASFMIP